MSDIDVTGLIFWAMLLLFRYRQMYAAAVTFGERLRGFLPARARTDP